MDYPAAKETHVVYNVTRSDFDPEGHHSDVTYISTVARPPAVDDLEVREVCRATERCIKSQLRDIPQVNELHEEIFGTYSVVWDEWGDRTILVSLRHLGSITLELLISLQSSVLKKSPLWRIWICDDSDPDEGILVYLDTIVAGTVSRYQPIADVIEEWRFRASDRWERRFGPMRRQIAWVEGHLKGALAQLGIDKLRAIGAFDNYDGDYERHSLWAVQRFQPNHAVLYGTQKLSHEPFGVVTPEGRLGQRGVSASDGVLVAIYIVPPARSHVYDIGDLNDAGWRHHVSLPLVTDEELRTGATAGLSSSNRSRLRKQ